MLLDRKIPLRYILNKIKFEMVYVLLIVLAVHYVTTRYRFYLPDMPLTIPVFLGTAISILLSFKLNQSYDRWWEARKIWGAIVNDSRSFIMQLQSLTNGMEPATLKKFAYRQIAWCYALGETLRGKDALQHIQKYVTEEELATITKHSNKPLALLYLHNLEIARLKQQAIVDPYTLVQLNNTLVKFTDWQGMAERIKGTVFPSTYRKFLHFIIYLFVVTLSIALRDIPSVFEIPLLMLISAAFFLLERSATHLQDPFSNKPTDTAMTSIARNIEINLKQIIDDPEVPEPLSPSKYYLM